MNYSLSAASLFNTQHVKGLLVEEKAYVVTSVI